MVPAGVLSVFLMQCHRFRLEPISTAFFELALHPIVCRCSRSSHKDMPVNRSFVAATKQSTTHSDLEFEGTLEPVVGCSSEMNVDVLVVDDSLTH